MGFELFMRTIKPYRCLREGKTDIAEGKMWGREENLCKGEEPYFFWWGELRL